MLTSLFAGRSPRVARLGSSATVIALAVVLVGLPGGVARETLAADAPPARLAGSDVGPATIPAEPSLEATLAAGSGSDAILDVSGYFVDDASGATYVPTAPVRLLDTRTGNGLSGTFLSGTPRAVQIAGRGGVPTGALAVTVNLTVTAQTSAGYVSLTPTPTATPATSSINFPLGDNRANGLTVPLGPDGSLAAVYKSGAGARTHLIIDVTGWFLADPDGATYVPTDPVRLLDTRVGNGLSGTFLSGTPRTFPIGGRGGVPVDALAVTVNLTVTQQTSAGYVSLTPLPVALPSTSSINFPLGDNRANGLTVPLGAGGTLSAVFRGGSGARTHLILDVTGYFVDDPGGATYVPIEPDRLLDTRSATGLAGMFASALPRTFPVAGEGDIPADAVAVTANLTVTNQTSRGYISVTRIPTGTPATSSLNFPRGDNRANGLTLPLDTDGALSVVFKGAKGPNYPAYDSLYHNEWEMITTIRAAEIAYPAIVDVFTVGRSHEGRPVWAAKISDNVATDEPEPEILFDALHHAREHLTIEQGLDILSMLTTGYGSNAQVDAVVDGRETWIIFALNPDGWAYDLTGSPYVGWRKNRQPNAGSSAVGTDPNRNYDYRWACCGGSSGSPGAWNYRGPAPFSSQETRIIRNFVNSRIVDGVQQLKTHVTLHTNGELILYPPGYTKTDVPSGMTLDDQRTFVAMARAMAALNGYKVQQSSDLYITDGDQIDWMYFRHGIFSFTFELYPTEQVSSRADHEPPDEVIEAQTLRNRTALLYLMEMADCPYAAIGKQATYCPPD